MDGCGPSNKLCYEYLLKEIIKGDAVLAVISRMLMILHQQQEKASQLKSEWAYVCIQLHSKYTGLILLLKFCY